jgi:hypothetical protein
MGDRPMPRTLTILTAVLVCLLGASLSMGPSQSAQPGALTKEEMDKLEPEVCKEGSNWFRTLTAMFPPLVGSPTRGMELEQISLIDQYKAEGRRKLWILRVPAAFITFRPCDSGRSNSAGEGLDMRVSQNYELDLVLSDDDRETVPLTRASETERKAGIPVQVSIANSLRNTAKRQSSYRLSPWMIGRLGSEGLPGCREEPSRIPGLVTFKRIDQKIRSSLDCESYEKGVYARKTGELAYESVTHCEVKCRTFTDYRGWAVQYSFDFFRLDRWRQVTDQIRSFLDQHTLYVDQDE